MSDEMRKKYHIIKITLKNENWIFCMKNLWVASYEKEILLKENYLNCYFG
jgi:uncharacterized protein YqgQ